MSPIRSDLRRDREVRRAIRLMWPVLSPQRLLDDLFSAPDRLASAGASLTESERALLLREPGQGWSAADVPLLDEAAELLGEDDRAARAQAEAERRARVAYAQGVLDIMSRDAHDDDPEILMGADMLDADRFADRHQADALPDRGRARGSRPDLGVRARHRGRGPGALGDGVADADAALPGQIHDPGR